MPFEIFAKRPVLACVIETQKMREGPAAAQSSSSIEEVGRTTYERELEEYIKRIVELAQCTEAGQIVLLEGCIQHTDNYHPETVFKCMCEDYKTALSCGTQRISRTCGSCGGTNIQRKYCSVERAEKLWGPVIYKTAIPHVVIEPVRITPSKFVVFTKSGTKKKEYPTETWRCMVEEVDIMLPDVGTRDPRGEIYHDDELEEDYDP